MDTLQLFCKLWAALQNGVADCVAALQLVVQICGTLQSCVTSLQIVLQVVGQAADCWAAMQLVWHTAVLLQIVGQPCSF